MMAAAMAALPGMFPAPSHGATGNEGAPDELTFVSLSPELYEIPPSTVISDKNTKGEPMDMLGEKTQLFYAEPEKEGQTSTVAALSGTKMALVAKRKGVPVTEAGGKSLKFCWGRLDNLIATQQVDMWHRPSASFFSMCFSYAEEGTPQVKGTSKYKLVPGSYQDQIDDKRLKTAKEKLKAAPLSVSFDDDMFTKVIDFKECPWFAMLRRENNSKSNTSLSDQKAVEKYRDKIKDVTQPAEGKKTIDKREYPHWIDYTKQGAKSAIGLRTGRSTWSLVAEGPLKALNLAATSNGDKYPVFGEWLYLGASFWHRDDYRHKQKKDDTHTYYHLLPISGAVFSESDFDAANKLLSLGKQKEEPTITEGRTKIATSIDVPIAKAVILAPEDELFKRKVFLLGIMADWHSENAENDALSLNTCCMPRGGHTSPVKIPEYAMTDFVQPNKTQQGVDAKGVGKLHVNRDQEGRAELRLPEGTKKIKLSDGWGEPIAYQAGAANRRLKLVVALPYVQYMETISSGNRSQYQWSLKGIENNTWGGFVVPDGKYWAAFSPEMYSISFNSIEFNLIENAENITVVDCDNSEHQGYSLYEVTVQATSPLSPKIKSGRFETKWIFSLRREGREMATYELQSHMYDIYTIFGPSTWPSSGVISSTPGDQNPAVLPWKDALDVLCTQIFCNENTYVQSNSVTWANRNNEDLIMSAIQQGIARTTTYNPHASDEGFTSYAEGGAAFRLAVDGTRISRSADNTGTYDFNLSEMCGTSTFTVDENEMLVHGLIDRPIVCRDAACLFATLPRICGYTHCIAVHQVNYYDQFWTFETAEEAAKKLASLRNGESDMTDWPRSDLPDEDHTYNVRPNASIANPSAYPVYDATPKEENSQEMTWGDRSSSGETLRRRQADNGIYTYNFTIKVR